MIIVIKMSEFSLQQISIYVIAMNRNSVESDIGYTLGDNTNKILTFLSLL